MEENNRRRRKRSSRGGQNKKKERVLEEGLFNLSGINFTEMELIVFFKFTLEKTKINLIPTPKSKSVSGN